MKLFGMILITVGVVGLVVAFNMDTTVEVPKATTIGDQTFNWTERVYNFGLMEQRSGWLIVSGMVFLGGILLFGFGALSEQLQAGMLGKVSQSQTANPVTIDTTLDLSKAPKALDKAGFEKSDIDRLLGGEHLPPKFDERGRPLQPTAEQGGFTQFLKSE